MGRGVSLSCPFVERTSHPCSEIPDREGERGRGVGEWGEGESEGGSEGGREGGCNGWYL